jgi:hypothetical protein
MVDPSDVVALAILEKATGYSIEPLLANPAQLHAAHVRHFGRTFPNRGTLAKVISFEP